MLSNCVENCNVNIRPDESVETVYSCKRPKSVSGLYTLYLEIAFIFYEFINSFSYDTNSLLSESCQLTDRRIS